MPGLVETLTPDPSRRRGPSTRRLVEHRHRIRISRDPYLAAPGSLPPAGASLCPRGHSIAPGDNRNHRKRDGTGTSARAFVQMYHPHPNCPGSSAPRRPAHHVAADHSNPGNPTTTPCATPPLTRHTSARPICPDYADHQMPGGSVRGRQALEIAQHAPSDQAIPVYIGRDWYICTTSRADVPPASELPRFEPAHRGARVGLHPVTAPPAARSGPPAALFQTGATVAGVQLRTRAIRHYCGSLKSR